MCVIIVKKRGVKMPDMDVLKACAKANPHGFGFATANHICKTLDFDEFVSGLSKVGDNENCIIHFRYATHGSICRENCHPFNMDDVMFAHNGILDIEPHGDMTDSETAFQDIIMPMIRKHGLDSVYTRQAIERVRGYSRFAFIKGNRLRIFGQFYEMNGLMFSNLNFMRHARRPGRMMFFSAAR